MLLSNIHMDLLNMPLNQMSTVTATAMRIRLARTAKFMKAMHGVPGLRRQRGEPGWDWVQ